MYKQRTPIEVKAYSSDVVHEEQFLFTQADGEDETEEQTLETKELSPKKAPEGVAEEEDPSSMKPSIKKITKIDENTMSYSIVEIKANAQIRVEQDVDLVLKNRNLKSVGQPYDEVLLTTDKRFKHYKAKENPTILTDELFFRKCYGEIFNIKQYQISKLKQLVDEMLQSLHGEFVKHPGIPKTIIAYRQKYYYPNMAMAQLNRHWVQ